MLVPVVQETVMILPTATICKQSDWCCGLRRKRVAKHVSASSHSYKRAPWWTGVSQRAMDRGIWARVSCCGTKGWSGGGCCGWATMTRSCVRSHLPLSCSCGIPDAQVSEVRGIRPVALSPKQAWVWGSQDHSSWSSERGHFKEQGVLLCLSIY